MSSGSSNFRAGKATSVRYGGGGSGEPLTLDVVHGTRLAMPTGLIPDFLAESAARAKPMTRASAPSGARERLIRRMTRSREKGKSEAGRPWHHFTALAT